MAGRRPVEEAFAARRPARRLLVVPERRAALDELVLHATTLRLPVLEVEGGSLTSLCGFDGHQGVALVVEARRWATLEEVIAAARSQGEPPFILVLDHLEDPQNVGTLLRSAEAVGVHGVLFPARRAAPLGAAAVKASSGATEHLRLVPLEDLASGVADLHARGIRVVGADEKAPLTLRQADLRGPLAMVVGSEGQGLDARVRRRIDVLARIPLRGRIASLNAAVAGSVALFEAAAQRSTAGEWSEGLPGRPVAHASAPDPPAVMLEAAAADATTLASTGHPIPAAEVSTDADVPAASGALPPEDGEPLLPEDGEALLPETSTAGDEAGPADEEAAEREEG